VGGLVGAEKPSPHPSLTGGAKKYASPVRGRLVGAEKPSPHPLLTGGAKKYASSVVDPALRDQGEVWWGQKRSPRTPYSPEGLKNKIIRDKKAKCYRLPLS